MKQNTLDFANITILITFIVLAIGTFAHEYVFHGLVARLFGWTVESSSSDLFTGQTTSLVPTTAPYYQIWLYYMIPATSIFILVFLLTILFLSRPSTDDKLVMGGGIVLLGINIPSLYPDLIGSDSNQALTILITNNIPPFLAYIFHYLLFVLFFILWCYYIFIVIENNPKDAKKRLQSLTRYK